MKGTSTFPHMPNTYFKLSHGQTDSHSEFNPSRHPDYLYTYNIYNPITNSIIFEGYKQQINKAIKLCINMLQEYNNFVDSTIFIRKYPKNFFISRVFQRNIVRKTTTFF